MRPALPLAALLVAAACSSSSSASPNKTPGQCVLSDGFWYGGTGYGDFPDCPGTSGNCNGYQDSAPCFSCLYETAGASCSCTVTDAGAPTWQCEPSGTGCAQ
ncbi:MAG TPA: hypothetical protein VIJ22_04145 [Polyangiaceae bacterium]